MYFFRCFKTHISWRESSSSTLKWLHFQSGCSPQVRPVHVACNTPVREREEACCQDPLSVLSCCLLYLCFVFGFASRLRLCLHRALSSCSLTWLNYLGFSRVFSFCRVSQHRPESRPVVGVQVCFGVCLGSDPDVHLAAVSLFRRRLKSKIWDNQIRRKTLVYMFQLFVYFPLARHVCGHLLLTFWLGHCCFLWSLDTWPTCIPVYLWIIRIHRYTCTSGYLREIQVN